MKPEDSKKEKWEKINTLMKRDDKAALQEELTGKISIQKDMISEPDGIIAKYKAKHIERKAGIKLIKTWYESQLEVAEHQLKTAVQLKKKEVEIDAEHFLMDLNKRHLRYLSELEFSNLEERYNALEKLGDAASKNMAKIYEKDWPQKMVDETIQGITDLYRKFFEKIMQE